MYAFQFVFHSIYILNRCRVFELTLFLFDFSVKFDKIKLRGEGLQLGLVVSSCELCADFIKEGRHKGIQESGG